MLLTEEDQNENIYSFSRSRSSQDVTIAGNNPEMENIKDEQIKAFSRKGALRKRAIGCYDNKLRHSVFNLSTIEKNNGGCIYEDFKIDRPSDINGICQKIHKNSMVLSLVKDVWKSLKIDLKNNEQEIENRKKLLKTGGNSLKKSKSSEEPNQNVSVLINKLVRSVVVNRISVNWITECSWTDIVETKMDFTKRNCDLQASIWELIETEASCLNLLSIVVEVFLPVFYKCQMRFAELENIDRNLLFGNIDEVYKCHVELWKTCISLPLLKSRSDNEPLDILLMKPGFLSISTIMSGYKAFMQAHGSMEKRFQELERSNSMFKEYLMWTRSYSKLYRNGILSILFVPFQRITKYKLLLERIKGFSNEEQSNTMNEMINGVHEFINYINSIVNKDLRLEEIKSQLVINPFVGCGSIDILKLQEHKSLVFDITESLSGLPERVLVYEGRLRLKISLNKRMDVRCFLFNDLILVCKPIRKDWNKLTTFKSPIRIDKFMIKEDTEGAFLALIFNDFGSIEYFMEFVGENDEIKLWIDKCNKTRELFQSHYGAALKITDNFFSIRSETKIVSEPKDNKLQEVPSQRREAKKNLSEASVSGYSTSPTESFTSLYLGETSDESYDTRPISMECQIPILSDISSSLD